MSADAEVSRGTGKHGHGRGTIGPVELDIVFLGTSASAPTARRGTSAQLVRRGGDRLLFDCGEGTQRQLLRSSIGLVDIEEIYITHFHADHYLGLPGMLKTFALRTRETPLTVYGPAGLRELFDRPETRLREAQLPRRARRAEPRRSSARTTATRSAPSPSSTACRHSATRSSSRSVPDGSTTPSPTRSACHSGPSAGPSSGARP